MRVVDFAKLSRPIQERFAACVNRLGPPMPYFAVRRARPARWVASGGAAAGLILLLLFARAGFGEPTSAFGLQPIWAGAIYALLAAAIAYAVVKAVAAFRETATLPFPAGVYVFGSGVIDARGHDLVVHGWRDLSSVDSPPGSRTAVFCFARDVKFRFSAADGATRDRLLAALAEARAAFEQAESAPHPQKVLAAHDPLEDGGFANPFLPPTSIIPPAPRWIVQPWLLAVAAAALAGPLVLFARNRWSDQRMFDEASREGSPALFEAYLSRGGRKTEEATLSLARAELKIAEGEGSVAAVQAFAMTHPGQIDEEVTGSLRKAMLAELAKAQKAHSVAALRDFRAHYDGARLVQTELAAAVHDLYQQAFESFRRSASGHDASVAPFVQRLLAYAEQNGPAVHVQIRRHPPRTVGGTEAQLRKSPLFAGVQSLPARYFDDAHDAPRDAELGKTLVDRLGQAFPRDVLAFDLANPPPPAADGAEQPVTVPTLLVDHLVELSGVYPSKRPRAVFAGGSFSFDASFAIPADPKPLKIKLSLWRSPDSATLKQAPAEAPEESVYAAEASQAYEQFTQKFFSSFFKRVPGTAKSRSAGE